MARGTPDSPLEETMFESWFEGTPSVDHRDGEAQQWPVAAQSGNAGWLLGPGQARLVRRRQFANKSCQAEEEQVSCSCARAARS